MKNRKLWEIRELEREVKNWVKDFNITIKSLRTLDKRYKLKLDINGRGEVTAWVEWKKMYL